MTASSCNTVHASVVIFIVLCLDIALTRTVSSFLTSHSYLSSSIRLQSPYQSSIFFLFSFFFYCVERPCPKGFACKDVDSIVRCEKGQWCPERTIHSIQCPEGHVCETPATKEKCANGTRCPEGSYQMLECVDTGHAGEVCLGGRDYEPCPPGQYCPTVKASITCSPGHYCPYKSVMERPCLAGTMTGEEGQSQCRPCALGTYQPDIGQVECIDCLPGTYADHPGSKKCTSCGSAFTSISGATSSAQCIRISDDVEREIFKSLLVSIPAAAGAVLMFALGIWLRRKQNDRTWLAYPGHAIANRVRKYVGSPFFLSCLCSINSCCLVFPFSFAHLISPFTTRVTITF